VSISHHPMITQSLPVPDAWGFVVYSGFVGYSTAYNFLCLKSRQLACT